MRGAGSPRRSSVALARFREPLIATVASEHPLAGQEDTSLAAFMAGAKPFSAVLWGTPESARLIRLASDGAPETPPLHEMVRLLVSRDRDGALFPRSFVRDDLEAGRLIDGPLTDETTLARDLTVVRQAGASALSRAAHDFAAAIRDEARDLILR